MCGCDFLDSYNKSFGMGIDIYCWQKKKKFFMISFKFTHRL